MFPELFRIPFTTLTIKTYGLMLVIAFLAIIYLIKRLSKNIIPNPQMITNGALYAIITGIVGSRVFYVFHYWDNFRDNIASAFAIWDGGFEQLGGAIPAIIVIYIYIRYHKLPARKLFDIVAIALPLALAIGRIGCFSSGCCYGKPADVPWAVRFPYASDSFYSQIEPDLERNRPKPYINLPSDFFEGHRLKPYNQLSDEQKKLVTSGPYRSLPVHPTQLYSSAAAFVLMILLYLYWRRNKKINEAGLKGRFLSAPGSVFAFMFISYAIGRFLIEFLRDDNPFEYGWWALYKGGTVSQNICIYMFIFGLALLFVFQRMAAKKS
jgi:phosphatidylglycerol:prolipoprotein diacylglycerol transferase